MLSHELEAVEAEQVLPVHSLRFHYFQPRAPKCPWDRSWNSLEAPCPWGDWPSAERILGPPETSEQPV